MNSCKDNNNRQIACVIVTYNRKQLLKRCIDAVACQTFKPATVYITDNASTDGTIDSVKKWGYYNCEKDGIQYKYILNSKNEGGAGGFYLGMKTAFEEGVYDGFWVMDDDGEPENDCLIELVAYLGQYDYIAPIVLSDEDHRTCSFAQNFEDVDVFSRQMGVHDGIIDNWASPFNGILYSKRLIAVVGFPKKEMFIWGDEINYHYRCLRKNMVPTTILKAVHYHPLNRQEYGSYLGRGLVTNINDNWKVYCYLRNYVYNLLRVIAPFPKNIYKTLRDTTSIIAYYHINKGVSWGLLLSAAIAGIFGYFNGLNKILK